MKLCEIVKKARYTGECSKVTKQTCLQVMMEMILISHLSSGMYMHSYCIYKTSSSFSILAYLFAGRRRLIDELSSGDEGDHDDNDCMHLSTAPALDVEEVSHS